MNWQRLPSSDAYRRRKIRVLFHSGSPTNWSYNALIADQIHSLVSFGVIKIVYLIQLM
jgi:hypothetical protein